MAYGRQILISSCQMLVISEHFVNMVRGRPLSKDLRNLIIAAHIDGMSGRNIAKSFKIPRSTVRNMVTLFKKEGNVETKVKTGRISKITERDRRSLRTLIKQDRRVSSRELAVKWGDVVGRRISKDTCLRHVKKMGYGFYKAKEKPLLTRKQKKARFLWVKDRRYWTQAQWDSIIWSDESKFEVFVGDTRRRILRRPGEEYHSDCLRHSVKFPASVMVWGCMSSQGVGRLRIIEGTVNAQKYKTILEEELLPSIGQLQLPGGEYSFQQDGASCHTAKIITTWFQEQHIPVIKWPSSSPDLSPIETLWHEMKKRLRTAPVRTVHELKSKLQEIWDNFTPEFCSRLVQTMPKRIEAVLKQKGDCTQW